MCLCAFEVFPNDSLREGFWSKAHYEEIQILFLSLCHGQCFSEELPLSTNYMVRLKDGE